MIAHAGCANSYRTPEFDTGSRNDIARSIDEVGAALDAALDWAPEYICRIGTCDISPEQCLGREREAARIRFVWLSCLDDSGVRLTAGAERDGSRTDEDTTTTVSPSPADTVPGPRSGGDWRERPEPPSFVECAPRHYESYRQVMDDSEPERATWLREQLELVDEIRRRLRTEIPQQLTEFEERVRQLEVEISSLRAEYQSEMEDLRLSGAPGEAIGTWEDRYQTAITDLDAIEERLAELKTEVDTASEFARRRYAEAAARIASSGFPEWRTVTCEDDPT